jgi:hypothetical protein
MEKDVMRYLMGKINYRIRYISDWEIILQGYAYSDEKVVSHTKKVHLDVALV